MMDGGWTEDELRMDGWTMDDRRVNGRLVDGGCLDDGWMDK